MGRAVAQECHFRHVFCRLRLGRERRGEEGARPGTEERSPVHYSITWSARCRSDGGIVRPRALAVLRLMTSSNFVASSTGRSAGLAPVRILSTLFHAPPEPKYVCVCAPSGPLVSGAQRGLPVTPGPRLPRRARGAKSPNT